MGKERKSKKLSISEKAQKIMEEINEKAKNPETRLKALELIEQHLGELSMHAFYITLDLSKSDQQEIKEKAEGILKKYYEENPEFRDLGEKLDSFKKAFSPIHEMMQAIEAQQRILQKLPLQAIAAGEIGKLYRDWSTKLLEVQKRLYPKIELPKFIIPEEMQISSESRRLAIIEVKLEEISKEIQELKKSRTKIKKSTNNLRENLGNWRKI